VCCSLMMEMKSQLTCIWMETIRCSTGFKDFESNQFYQSMNRNVLTCFSFLPKFLLILMGMKGAVSDYACI
jgi:hypothetical protein